MEHSRKLYASPALEDGFISVNVNSFFNSSFFFFNFPGTLPSDPTNLPLRPSGVLNHYVPL